MFRPESSNLFADVVADGYGVAVHHGYWLMSVSAPVLSLLQALYLRTIPYRIFTLHRADIYQEHDGKKGMETTDVLDRYRAYAQENICKS